MVWRGVGDNCSRMMHSGLCHALSMNEEEIMAFIQNFNISRSMQDGADLGTQVEELMTQNALIAQAIVSIARAQNGSATA